MVAVLAALVLGLGACTADGAAGDDRDDPAGFDVVEVRQRIVGGKVRCTGVDRDPTEVAGLPVPAATVGCEADGVKLEVSEYRDRDEVSDLLAAACSIGMDETGYAFLRAGTWIIEVDDEFTERSPSEVLAPLAEELGIEVEPLRCP